MFSGFTGIVCEFDSRCQLRKRRFARTTKFLSIKRMDNGDMMDSIDFIITGIKGVIIITLVEYIVMTIARFFGG